MSRIRRQVGKLKTFGRDHRGGVLIYVALAIPVFLGVSGLAVDISVWHAHKRAIQTLADAGAVAGASELSRMTTASNRESLADAAVREDALASGAKASDVITVNIPPTAGDFIGATNAVEVIVTRDVPTMLSRLINPNDTQVSSRSVAFAAEGQFCVYSLNTSSPNAFQVSGGAQMDLSCGVMVNSDASAPDDALHVTGGGCLNANYIKVVGDYSAGGCYNDAEPFQQTEAIGDPLSGYFSPPPEATATCASSAKITVEDAATNGPYDLSAGRHCGAIEVKNGGVLRLASGTHVIDKGLSAVGGEIIGQPSYTGVTLYFPPDTNNSTTLDLSSNPRIDLKAPESGPYEGLLIYVDEAATGNVKHNLTANSVSVLDGLIYMPGHDVDIEGQAGAQMSMLIADEIKLSGGASFTNSTSIPFFTAQEELKPRLSE